MPIIPIVIAAIRETVAAMGKTAYSVIVSIVTAVVFALNVIQLARRKRKRGGQPLLARDIRLLSKLSWKYAAILIPIGAYGAWFAAQLIIQSYEAGIAAVGPNIARVEEKVDKQLSDLLRPEPQDSLRKRTLRLVERIEEFQRQRNSFPPNPGYGDQAIAQRYAEETDRLCVKNFGQEMIGIPLELQSKGLNVEYLADMQTVQPRCWYQNDLEKVRNLAYRLNGNGGLVRF